MQQQQDMFSFKDFRRTVVEQPKLWVIPAVVVAGLALVFAIVRTPSWEASQALLIREEGVTQTYQLGRFSSQEDMKTAQETVMQLVTSHRVVEAALQSVDEGKAPSADDIESLQGNISISAPNGAEFGRTEVFYLTVADKNREQAIVLSNALYQELVNRLGDLRNVKAGSLTAELENSVNVAAADLTESTNKLASMETAVGTDLAELRILTESTSGESTLRSTLTQIRNELRQAEESRLTSVQLLTVLNATKGNPQKLVATPSRLLVSQPAIQRLKDGLVDAQLRTSTALGMMSPQHPKVISAQAEEEDVRRRLRDELATAIEGLKIELNLADGQITALKQQEAKVAERMNTLAGMRADYQNASAEVKQRTEILNKAQKDLADARASQAASHTTSLLTRLDEPRTGSSPAGPSRSMIVLAGIVGGLFTGLGVVVLVGSPVTSPNRVNYGGSGEQSTGREENIRREVQQSQERTSFANQVAEMLLGDPTTVN